MEQLSILDLPVITSPVPSYRSHVEQNEQIPLWAEQVAASLQTRQAGSTASSVVSTRTKISTNTAQEDACSVDLSIAGLHYRINRDASRITSRGFPDTLPPYRPRLEAESANGGRGSDRQGQHGRGDRSVTTETADQRRETLHHLLFPETQHLGRRIPVNHLATPPNGISTSTTDMGLSRNLSFTPGKDKISVTKRRAVSQNDVPRISTIRRKPLEASARLHRRNGIRLPPLITNFTNVQQPRSVGGQGDALDSAAPHRRYPHSADPRLGHDSHSHFPAPPSPVFIGRHAPGLFPSPPMVPSSPRHPSTPDDQATIRAHSPATHEEGYADVYPPPPMDSENDISVHYTRLVRTIDRDHRQALHERDKDMAKLRERLNEQDTIYRQQLRARDFIIDDLKSRIAYLETATAATVEKACNSVEDIWESRWKDRDFHLTERMRRLEAELPVAVEKAVAARDKLWAKGWAIKYRQLMRRLEDAGQVPQHGAAGVDANPPVL